MNKTNVVQKRDLVYLQDMPTGGGSDYDLKEKIENLPPSLDEIQALRPVAWSWKDKEAGEYREVGFIAQEIEEVFPELVYTDTWIDGTKRKFFRTKALLPYLVVALQEQQAQIEELRAKLDKK